MISTVKWFVFSNIWFHIVKSIFFYFLIVSLFFRKSLYCWSKKLKWKWLISSSKRRWIVIILTRCGIFTFKNSFCPLLNSRVYIWSIYHWIKVWPCSCWSKMTSWKTRFFIRFWRNIVRLILARAKRNFPLRYKPFSFILSPNRTSRVDMKCFVWIITSRAKSLNFRHFFLFFSISQPSILIGNGRYIAFIKAFTHLFHFFNGLFIFSKA